MLTADQVERMRDTFNDQLLEEATVYERVLEDDGGGGYGDTWIELGTYPVKVGGPLGGESDERSISRVRLEDAETQFIWFPAKTPVEEEYELEWNGKRWEILIIFRRGVWELGRRVRIKEK